MRRGWIALLACLLPTTSLHAAPVVTPADAAPVNPQHTTPVDTRQVEKQAPVYKAVDKLKITSVDPRVNIGDVGILTGIASTELVQAGGLYMVNQFDDTHPTSAEKAALIRNANHKIDGNEVDVLRAVGDVDGSVYVQYTVRNGQGGRNPHIRKIKPDNGLGFDVQVLLEPKAGIAPDGAGGVYVVTHKTFDSDNNFYTDSTAHQSLRIDAAGATTWQVAEAGAPQPHGNPDYWSSAARSNQGVYVGYGVGTSGSDDPTPVLLHRKAGDGSKLYTRTGLKAPAAGSSNGTTGNTPLRGLVDRIWPQSDGSVVARVFNSTADQMFVRVDSGGTQTAAFKCPEVNPQLLPHNNGVVCVGMPADGTIHLHHYGLTGGNLQKLGSWTSAAINGWDFDHIAVTVDGQYLATAKTSGFAGIALFSPVGVLLVKELATARPGYFTGLIVGGHDWLAMHKSTYPEDLRPSVFRGTLAPGRL